MVDDTENEIVILDDTEKPDANEDVADPVAELNRQFEALKKDNEKRKDAETAALRRAADAERFKAAADADVAAVRARLAEQETDTITASISAAQAEAESARAEYAAAAESGDFKKQAEALSKISRSEVKLAQFELTKAQLHVRKSEAPAVVDRSRTPATDAFEDHLTRFTPRTADWMREHKDWVTDTRKNAKLVGAHHMAVGDGMTPDTDEYFSHVEKTLGIGQAEEQPERTNGAGNAKPLPQRRASPMVAPVNGGAGGHSSGSGDSRAANSVTLTKGERDRAEDGSIVWNRGNLDPKTGEPIKDGDPRIGKPIGRQEYARRKQALERGGYYDKTYSHG